MKLRSAISSAGSGALVPDFDIVSSDGSCSPASENAIQLAMKQTRTAATKAARERAREKALELQQKVADRRAAYRILRELRQEDGELERRLRLQVRIIPNKPNAEASPVRKPTRGAASRRRYLPSIVSPSSWLVDDRGERGVIWQQSYIGRSTADFYRGLTRDKWEYDARDEAVVRDGLGQPMIISNMGDDWQEIGVAWQALEDASPRKNAKIMMRVVIPLDSEATLAEKRAAVAHFCETVLKPLGLPYSATIHEPSASEKADERNWHAHLSFSLRPMTRAAPYAWDISNAVRSELDGRDAVQAFRHLWAHSMTVAAERCGRAMRYTGLSHAARGTGHEVGEHLGEGRNDMVRRGDYVAAHARNMDKFARNQARRTIRDLDRKISALEELQIAALAAQLRDERAHTVRVALTPGRGASVVGRPITSTRSEMSRTVRPLLNSTPVPPSREPLRLRSTVSAPVVDRPRLNVPGAMAARQKRRQSLITVSSARNRTTRMLRPAVAPPKSSRTMILTQLQNLTPPAPLSAGLATEQPARRLLLRPPAALAHGLEPLYASSSDKPRAQRAPLVKPSPQTEHSLVLERLKEWLIYIEDQRQLRARKKRTVDPIGPSAAIPSVPIPDSASTAIAVSAVVPTTRTMRQDGFGGLTEDRPIEHDVPPIVHKTPVAFDADFEPTPHLLETLVAAREHAWAIHVATDGKLTTDETAPTALRMAVHNWRDDGDVTPLLRETVKRARLGGDRRWPQSVARNIETFLRARPELDPDRARRATTSREGHER